MIPSPVTCTRPTTTIATVQSHVGVEPDTGLITACELTAGSVGDAQAARPPLRAVNLRRLVNLGLGWNEGTWQLAT